MDDKLLEELTDEEYQVLREVWIREHGDCGTAEFISGLLDRDAAILEARAYDF